MVEYEKKENITNQSANSDDLDLLAMYDVYLDRWIEVDNELRSFKEFVEDYYKSLSEK